LSLSLINPALEQLQDLPAGNCALLADECPSLLECLRRVPDPRDPRGVRHTLTSLLQGRGVASGASFPGRREDGALRVYVNARRPQHAGGRRETAGQLAA
jgi:hypothetical protein